MCMLLPESVMEVANPGETIVVRQGIYRENINLTAKT